jgi:hypothetical protein
MLSVWATVRGKRAKVLNIEWWDGGAVELVSFRRGPWEAELSVAGAPYLRVVN